MEWYKTVLVFLLLLPKTCVVKLCPELSWVNLRNYWRQKFLAYVVGGGISVRER